MSGYGQTPAAASRPGSSSSVCAAVVERQPRPRRHSPSKHQQRLGKLALQPSCRPQHDDIQSSRGIGSISVLATTLVARQLRLSPRTAIRFRLVPATICYFMIAAAAIDHIDNRIAAARASAAHFNTPVMPLSRQLSLHLVSTLPINLMDDNRWYRQ